MVSSRGEEAEAVLSIALNLQVVVEGAPGKSQQFRSRLGAWIRPYVGPSGTVICMPGEWSEGEYGWLYGEGKSAPPKAAAESSDLPPPRLPPPGSPVSRPAERPPTSPGKKRNGRKIF